MEDETQIKKVRELYSKVVEVQFGFMGEGEFRLQKIYSDVKKITIAYAMIVLCVAIVVQAVETALQNGNIELERH